MTMKKDDRKNEYVKIMQLLLTGKNKEAYDAVAVMCGEDTGLYCLADYDEAMKARVKAGEI